MGCSPSKDEDVPFDTRRRGFRPIPDQFESYEQVQSALRQAGLESSNLVIAVDYTKSNTWSGEKSFHNKCLHDIDPDGFVLNPYERVIIAIGKTLQAFDDDNIIPAYGFGDLNTQAHACFPFLPDGGCRGVEHLLQRYREITPNLKLSGPTNFAPVIYESIKHVQSDGGYHILVIIADGQVTKDKETKAAIVEATKYPISIIMVGVGDGPWQMMEQYDDEIPQRRFDNFQFVEFNRVIQLNPRNPDVGFAISALQEIPDQYRTIRQLGLF